MKQQVYIIPDDIQGDMYNDIICTSDDCLDIEKICFSDTPYKQHNNGSSGSVTNVYIIDMYYKNKSIIIQLPKYKLINMTADDITIGVDKMLYQYLINPLEEQIILSVHDNSEKWFNGKKFTMNKIINSLDSPYSKQHNTLKLSINNNTVYFNKYKNTIQKDNIIINDNQSIDIICLVKIANLQFLNNKFTYTLQLQQAKVFMEEYLIKYSIIDDDDDGVDNISDIISITSSNRNS